MEREAERDQTMAGVTSPGCRLCRALLAAMARPGILVRMCPAALVTGILAGSLSPISATTYLVLPDGSGDFPTIQAAVDAATDGDVIELGNGVFRGEGNCEVVLNKNLTVCSVSGNPAHCIIDCEGSPSDLRRGLDVGSGLSSTTLLHGLTIIHGYVDLCGGAVYCRSSITFQDCVFADNTLEYSYGGGAVYCQGCAPTFVDCRFERNVSLYQGGGGVKIEYGGPARFDRCVFAENVGTWGGGCALTMSSSAEFTDCVFWANAASDRAGGAVACFAGSRATLENCTIVGNAADGAGSGLYVHEDVLVSNSILAWNAGGEAVYCGTRDAITMTCCDVFGNDGGDWVNCLEGQQGIDGNLCLDPLLCDWQGGDLHLQLGSPCAPEYHPACGLIGALPVGCGQTPTEPMTWGRLKAAFRK
jgi:hypothetical protein